MTISSKDVWLNKAWLLNEFYPTGPLPPVWHVSWHRPAGVLSPLTSARPSPSGLEHSAGGSWSTPRPVSDWSTWGVFLSYPARWSDPDVSSPQSQTPANPAKKYIYILEKDYFFQLQQYGLFKVTMKVAASNNTWWFFTM